MKRIKIGFVPSHREPFDEDWAIRMRQRCLDAFSRIPQLELVAPDESLTSKGLVKNDADADKVISFFKRKDIEGLIIGTMTFGDEVSALSVAAAFHDIPILLFGTKEDEFTTEGCRRSDSFCGTLSISSGLYRRQIPYLFAGIVFPEEKKFQESIVEYISVCSIIRGFIGANVGIVGPRPERFETCIYNEEAMMKCFKQRVIPISLPDIMQRDNVLINNSVDLKKIVRSMRKEANLSAVSPEIINKFAGFEYALKQFADEKQLSAMGIQCWTAMQSVYGISPCYVMGRFTDAGIMTSCEVDVYGALTMLIQYLASLSAKPPHFIDWTIQHQKQKNTFLAWHCGNAPPSLAASDGSKVNISYHSILNKTHGIDLTMGAADFQLKPGVVTLCRLHESGGKFKMFVTQGQAVKSNQKIRGCWSWIMVTDLDRLYRTLVNEGFTHHASLIHGDYTRAIVDACSLLGIEIIHV